ncbi:MAG TPA: 3-phosphoshikimate 1-carboxyvinyltransferase [Ilumatobacteraceae bacterium]
MSAALTRRIEPVGHPLHAVLDSIPGSKSIANRALVCAALADGRSTLRNVPGGDDTLAMMRCIAALGAGTSDGGSSVVAVDGTGGSLRPGPMLLHAGLAGTTSRFVTALAALGPGPYTVDGHAPLQARPMGPLHDALVALGARLTATDNPGRLPVTIGGGALRGGRISLPGDVSSQFVTALMLIGPYLEDGVDIALTTALVSRPYVEITAAVMGEFGATGVEIGPDRIVVPPGRYRGADLTIEPDASSASYVFGAAAICGGDVTVTGLGDASMQGDAAFADLLSAMGCEVERSGTTTMVRSTGHLSGIDVDMADISDTVPTLAVVAPFASSPTRITGVGFIRRKESDRIGDVVRELRRCGVRAHEEPDGMTIEPSAPVAARVHTYDDHRLAMAFALVGLRVPGIEIEDPDVVAKSWPGFWDVLRGLQHPSG